MALIPTLRLASAAALVFALLSASGVRATEPPPAADPGAARLVFTKGYDPSWRASFNQSYMVAHAARCTDLALGAFLDATRNTLTVPTPPGRIAIQATTNVTRTIYRIPTFELRDTSCVGAASFVAEAGHTYRVNQRVHGADASPNACAVEVVDSATNGPPPSLRTEVGPTACRALMAD